jgi:hypothetical protein
MKKLILILAAATFAFGQTPAPAPGPMAGFEIVRVVEVTRGDPNTIMTTLSAVLPGISRSGRMLVVRGSAEAVGMIEDAIKKLDVAPPPTPEQRPAPNVELTVQLLYGSSQESQTTAVPADLDSTVRQLRSLFPYKSYRVMDTLFMRGRSGSTVMLSGTLSGGDSSYRFRYNGQALPGAAPRTVRLDNLELGVTKTVQSAIQTTLDVREGQKTIIGKANVTGTDDAIILVITPKVIE